MNESAPYRPAVASPAISRQPDDAEAWLARASLAGALVVLLAARTLSLHEGRVTLPLLQWALPTTCTLRRLTGLACPGCGLTRALVALAHGDARAAWHFNPAGPVLFSLLVVQIPLSGWQVVRRWAGRPLWRLLPLYRLGAVALVTVLVGQWLVRLTTGRL